MRGFVEIYKGRDDDMELLHADDNIVVDGAKEHIADLLTFIPPPTRAPYDLSSTARSNRNSYLPASASLDTSNFNVRGMTIGSARGNYDFRNSRITPSASEEFQNHKGFYHLLPYVNNHDYRSYSWNEYSPFAEKVELFGDNKFESVGFDILKQHGQNILGINNVGTFNNFTRVHDYLLLPEGWTGAARYEGDYLGPGANGRGLRLKNVIAGGCWAELLRGSPPQRITEIDQTYKVTWDFLALDNNSQRMLMWDNQWGGTRMYPSDYTTLGPCSHTFSPKISSHLLAWSGMFRFGFGSTLEGTGADITIDNMKLYKMTNPPFGSSLFAVSAADFTQSLGAEPESQWEEDPVYDEDPYKQMRPKNWVVENEDYENWENGDKTGTINDPSIPMSYVSCVNISTEWGSPAYVSGLVFNRWVGDDPLTTGVSSLGMYFDPEESRPDGWNELSAGTYKLKYTFLGSNEANGYQLYVDNYPGGNPVDENTDSQEIAFLDTTPGTKNSYSSVFAYDGDLTREIEFTVDEQSEGRPFGIWANKFLDPGGGAGNTIPVYCGICHLRLYRRVGEDAIDPHWELILEGSPSFGNDTSGPGLDFKSSNVGDQAILRQNIELKKGNSYRFNITASGSDPVKIRLYRQRHTHISDPTEPFDFKYNAFLSARQALDASTGLYRDTGKIIKLTGNRSTHTVDFRIPENPIDTSAYSEDGTSYYWEIILPADASDFLSDISIDNVDLIDLEQEVLRNASFTETESIIPNSELLRKTLAPSYGANPKGLKILGVYDFSGTPDNIDLWRGAARDVVSPIDKNTTYPNVHQWNRQTHNPKVITPNAASITTSGSVSYVFSSVGLSSVPDVGYVDINCLNRGSVSPLTTRAHLGAEFQIKDLGMFTDSLGTLANSLGDKSRNIPMQLSFWYSTENPAADKPLTVTLWATDPQGARHHYGFSAWDPGNSGGWNQRNMWHESPLGTGGNYLTGPGTIPKTGQGEWKKISTLVNLTQDMYENPEDYKFDLRFRPLGQGSNWRSTYIKGISFGPIPGWRYGYLGPSSTAGISEGDALILDLFSHTDSGTGISDSGELFIGATFSGMVPAGVSPQPQYSLIVKYKTKAGVTDDTDVCNLQLSGVTGSGWAKWHYNWGREQNRWEACPPSIASNIKQKLSGTNGSFVTSSLPITGMNQEVGGHGPLFTNVHQEFFLRIGYEMDVQIEFESIKLMQTSRSGYTGSFNKDSLNPSMPTREQFDFTQDNPFWADGVMTKFDVSAIQVDFIPSGYVNGLDEGGYVQVINPVDIRAAKSGIHFMKTQRDLGIVQGDIVTVSYGQYDGGTSTYQSLVITVWDPIQKEQSWWNGSDWVNSGFATVLLSGNEVPATSVSGNYPFLERQASGIPIQGSQFHDDTRWKVQLYTANEAGGTPPFVHRRSPVKIYKTGRMVTVADGSVVFNQDISYASSLPNVDISPMDRTLQPASLDGSGPARMGHFLNSIEFSGAPESSGLKLEQVIQNGCFLPGSGLELGKYSFGHTDKDTVNAFSGIVSGMLNQQSVINSDGYIMETPGSVSAYTIKDSSAGYVVSATPVSSTYGLSAYNSNPAKGINGREVKYVLTLTANDWRFLDYYYGGLGNIGLHVFDFPATAKKFAGELCNDQVPQPFLNRDTGTPYGTPGNMGAGGKTSLYNLTDATKNPVFKLFAKKIFQPGGLKLNHVDYNDFITIVWGIKF